MRTPYYLIDKARLLKNLETISRLRSASGAKALLALKCFSSWAVFDLMREHLDGTTSSSLFEARLGREKFGGEVHGYSVAWADHEFADAVGLSDKIIFNSVGQFQRFKNRLNGCPCGLRINPGVSFSEFDLADTARPFSRLGEQNVDRIASIADRMSGFMLHFNCENEDYEKLDGLISEIDPEYGSFFEKAEWVSLGGGIHFTGDDYPIDRLAERLKRFSDDHRVQVYLEPGEAAVTRAATLEVSVLDTMVGEKNIAIVDASIEAHMLDLLTYRCQAEIEPDAGDHVWMICGRTCLAGDIFGEYRFPEPLKVGDRISIRDAAGYTMVKKNWFNGVAMPSIAVREMDGREHVIRQFGYEDFLAALS